MGEVDRKRVDRVSEEFMYRVHLETPSRSYSGTARDFGRFHGLDELRMQPRRKLGVLGQRYAHSDAPSVMCLGGRHANMGH